MLHFDRWKVALILLVCFAGLAYSAPNFIPKASLQGVPEWLPHQQINLGLDLRGGSYLLLAVDTASIVRDRQQSLVNDVRNALRSERIPYTGLGLQGEGVSVRITNPEDVEKAREAIEGLSTIVSGNAFSTLPERDLAIVTTERQITVALTEAEKNRADSIGGATVDRDRPPPYR